jgi:hypothetical protein
VSVFSDEIRALADRMTRRVMRHRERYIRAWVASTGLRPEESELIEETYPMDANGVFRIVVRVQPRRVVP